MAGPTGNIGQNTKALQDNAARMAQLEEEYLKKATNKNLTLKEAQKILIETEQEYENLLKQNKAIGAEQKKLIAANKVFNNSLKSAESSLKSLSGIYSGIGELEKERLIKTRQLGPENLTQVTSYNKMSGILQDIAKLNGDEVTEKALLLEEYKKEKDNLIAKGGYDKEILENLEQQKIQASALSSYSEEQKEQLQQQAKAYEGIKKSLGSVLATAGLLFSGFRGFLRVSLFAAGKGITELGKTTREFGGFLGGANISATALGFAFKDATETAKGLNKEFGGMNDISFQTQLNTNLMATNMGISGGEAAKLTGNLARLNGGSIETAQNLAASTKELAKQNGLVPSAIMADVAASSEEFALYGKQGGKNMLEAAVAAGKLGVNMSSLTKVTDNLLDFENSINQELELGAMLGKNLQLDRARALAYEGNIGGAVKETLQQLGGIEEFNRMDVFQKKKAAELLGLSVEEFQKMASNADKMNEKGEIQKSNFETLQETMSAIVTGPLGGFVSGLSGAIGTTKEMTSNFKDAGKALGKIFGIKKPGTTPSTSTTPTTTPTQSQTGPTDQANKMSKVNTTALIKGAVALLILAAALFVAAKAFQEFAEVTWESVGMGLAALVGLAGIAFLLSKMQGEMIKGALAVAILGLALIPFAYALNMMSSVDATGLAAAAAALVVFTGAVFGLGLLMMGPAAIVFGAGILALTALGGALLVFGAGLLMVGNGMSALTGALPAMVEQIAALSTINFLPIFGLAAALMTLSVALAAVAVTGMLALPALLALGLIAGGTAALMGGGNEGENQKMDELIGEIKALRGDLLSGKIGVNMDGQKVTAKISSVVSKVGSNSYAKV